MVTTIVDCQAYQPGAWGCIHPDIIRQIIAGSPDLSLTNHYYLEDTDYPETGDVCGREEGRELRVEQYCDTK